MFDELIGAIDESPVAAALVELHAKVAELDSRRRTDFGRRAELLQRLGRTEEWQHARRHFQGLALESSLHERAHSRLFDAIVSRDRGRDALALVGGRR